MPMKPAKPCCKPGCGSLTHERFCASHAQQHQQQYDKARGSSAARGYGWKWQQRRKRWLQKHPLCVWMESEGMMCQRPATDVDHIVPMSAGGADDESNYQSLCHAHHSKKTATEDGRWTGKRGHRG